MPSTTQLWTPLPLHRPLPGQQNGHVMSTRAIASAARCLSLYLTPARRGRPKLPGSSQWESLRVFQAVFCPEEKTHTLATGWEGLSNMSTLWFHIGSALKWGIWAIKLQNFFKPWQYSTTTYACCIQTLSTNVSYWGAGLKYRMTELSLLPQRSRRTSVTLADRSLASQRQARAHGGHSDW